MMHTKQVIPRLSMLLLLTAVAVGCGGQEEGEHQASVNQTAQTDSHAVSTIEIGTAIEAATTAMSDNGFEETMLAMESRDPVLSLKMWSVGDGVLVVLYNKSDSKLTSLEYLIITDGPKSTRQEFTMTVKRFDPITGELVLAMETPNENAG